MCGTAICGLCLFSRKTEPFHMSALLIMDERCLHLILSNLLTMNAPGAPCLILRLKFCDDGASERVPVMTRDAQVLMLIVVVLFYTETIDFTEARNHASGCCGSPLHFLTSVWLGSCTGCVFSRGSTRYWMLSMCLPGPLASVIVFVRKVSGQLHST